LFLVCSVTRAVTPAVAARTLLPTVIADEAGDHGAGPAYGDCLTAYVAGNGGPMIAAQKVNGTFPSQPAGENDTWSWRFDTDLNTNTGFQQYWYIGIDWEILVAPGAGGGWTVNKWSPAGGTVPLPDARLVVQRHADGDVIAVRFDPAEIGAPPHMNWIAWNGREGAWEDVAPEATVAWWER
jgi:hypothetical protein